jgi:hypothetical protein
VGALALAADATEGGSGMSGDQPDGMAGKFPVKNGGPADIQTAWKILAGGAPVAAAALVDIAENGKSEIARVQASQAVLDRVGLATPKERPSVTFHVVPKEFNEVGIGAQQLSPAEVIRGRLKKLGSSMKGLSADQAGHPGEVQDGDAEAGVDSWMDWDTGGEGSVDTVVEAELMPMDEETDGDPWS